MKLPQNTVFNIKNSKGPIEINSILVNNLAVHYARMERFRKASVNPLILHPNQTNKKVAFPEKLNDEAS